jgi:hypothetical protein
VASIGYVKELEMLQQRHTNYELESMLGMSHSTQGKTIRRWLRGKPARVPSENMRERIDRVFEALLLTQLYVDPPNPDDQMAWFRAEWKDRYELWRAFSDSKLVDMMRRIVGAKVKDESNPALFRIDITIDKPKDNGRFYFLGEDLCNERGVLIQLLFALQNMAVHEWQMLRNTVLRKLKKEKVEVYEQLNRRIGAL